MSTITKELAKLFRKITNSEIDAEGNAHVVLSPADSLLINNARIALASLEAEPVAWAHRLINKRNGVVHPWVYGSAEACPSEGDIFNIEVMPLYTVPPAPVSVPAAMEMDDDFDSAFEHGKAVGWNAYRAAMLQGAQPVSNRDELPDDFDFDRFNDVVWLEAVASNPHMHSPTTSTIAMVALELNKKLADGKPELTVWYGSMPESNGKANWTAILHRKGEGRCMDGFTIDRSEYPGRVLYAADRVRYLIGEKSERPSILDYDADAHSGYVKPGNSPVIPDGWVLVPIEPTEDMIVNGFESEPDEFFSDAELWEAYNAMTGCQQAAHRAKLCWAAMIAASQKS